MGALFVHARLYVSHPTKKRPLASATRKGAAAAEDEARRLLRSSARTGVTVREFWNDWTTDPLWLRPSTSTNLHNRERTTFTPPKHGFVRTIALTDPARERLLSLPRESEFAFTTL